MTTGNEELNRPRPASSSKKAAAANKKTASPPLPPSEEGEMGEETQEITTPLEIQTSDQGSMEDQVKDIVDNSSLSQEERDMVEEMLQFDPSGVIMNQAKDAMSPDLAQKVVYQGCRTWQLSRPVMLSVLNALFRKGAANAGASDNMSVSVVNNKGEPLEITRYGVKQIIQSIAGHMNIRRFAEQMAPVFLASNLAMLKLRPTMELKGDLADRINRNYILVKKKADEKEEPPLTRQEEVCCCTYAQWMPNLNELAGSTRLKRLMEIDLAKRATSNNKPSQKKAPVQAKPSPKKGGKKNKK